VHSDRNWRQRQGQGRLRRRSRRSHRIPLSVTKSGTGTGTVTSNPAGISCGATCSAEFTESTVVTLSKAADSGSEFVEWTGACTGTGACEVTMSAAKSVTATFDEAESGSEFTDSSSPSR
jgi:hypothetical protein